MRRRNIIITIALFAILVPSIFFATETFFLHKINDPSSPFYVGVECGYNNVTLCEAVIDKVKNYTNLFIISSTDIIENSTLLNEVSDYAYNAGLYFSVYFSPIHSYSDLGENISSSVTLPDGTLGQGGYYPSPLPMAWLNSSMAKYGDRFLGAYVLDEPGGIQLDGGGQRTVNAEQNAKQTCLSTSTAFVRGVNSSIQPYLNSSIVTFTADYGLYWFDYKAGYDMVLAELGVNNSNQMQVSLCRGAATAQNKDWGVMITHSPMQLMESGSKLYNDLVFSYNSGAKYAVVFDYAETSTYPKEQYLPYEYGILNDEHFDALKSFWNYTQSNPGKHGSLHADVALVLPQAYGFGFRSVNDNVWGIFSGDTWSKILWSDVNGYLTKYGSRLDIVYDDPAFNNAVKSSYSKVIQWTGDSASAKLPVRDLNTTFGFTTIQEAINSGATSDSDIISVKAGVYAENLVLNKTLSIVGQNKATTIIDGGDSGTGVNVTCSNASLSGFTIRNSGVDSSAGIYLDNVGNCSIADNIVTANYYGIYLNWSGSNTLRNNVMMGNVYNLGVDGNESAHFINNVDSSNTVNGKKVYYLIGNRDLNINPSTYPNLGYLAIVNCTGITVQNLSLNNNGNGILLVNTQNSTLTDNKVANNTEGLQLIDSEGNILRNNNLSGNTFNFWVQGSLLNNVDASNSINNKPIYYWISQNNKAVPSNAGYVALISCSDITVQDLNLSNNRQSIFLSSSTNSTISNNQISNSYFGIELQGSSSDNSIRENTVVNCTQGIALFDSGDNNIANNVLSNNQYGSYFTSSSFNTLSENKIDSNIDHGMQFTLNCNNNTIIGNNINRSNVGVEITDSLGNTIVQNSLTGNNRSIQIRGQSTNTRIAKNLIENSICGIEIDVFDGLSNYLGPYGSASYQGQYGYSIYPPSRSHIITQNTLTNNSWGIFINSVNNTDIADNAITGSNYGITLDTAFGGSIFSTSNNTLSGNNVSNSKITGISLNTVNNCSVIKNTVSNGQQGILFSNSQNNSLTGNVVLNTNLLGIQLSSSTGNTFRDNNLVGNNYGFDDESVNYGSMGGVVVFSNGHVQSEPPKYYTNDVDASNIINGKPIIYWVGQNNKIVPSDAACVILVNCTNITVQSLNLAGNSEGVQLAYTNNCTITGNNLQDNGIGIRLRSSSNNTINKNTLTDNGQGISLTQEVLTSYIDPTSQTPKMVTLPSTGNTITGNSIKSNAVGVDIGASYGDGSDSLNVVSGNAFYHNNFVNNKSQINSPTQPVPTPALTNDTQTSIQSPTAQNSWDNGKEGNYWSDYNGTDINHDGIGDSSYTVYANNTDHYPLMAPFDMLTTT